VSKATTEFAVLLYPPTGRPRVVEIPAIVDEIRPLMPVSTFARRADADAALEKFLNENPEFRRWNDGQIVPGAVST
jgi:hypothetical protein